MPSKKGLTDKQKVFIDEYIKTTNATKSAIHAGYSKRTAKQIGTENLKKPLISAAIAAAQALVREESLMSARQIREWWVAVIRGEINETFVGKDGKAILVPPKMADRVSASTNLAKSMGLFVDRMKFEGEGFILRFHAPLPPEPEKT